MRLAVVVVLAGAALSASAQLQLNQQTSSVDVRTEKKQAKELTSEERAAAATMLKTSEAEARALPPDLRAYALLQVARGYSRTAPAKAPAILNDSFTATTAISPDDKFTKESLQREILMALLPLDHAKLNALLPQAEEKPRSEIARQLLAEDIRAKKLDEAGELIDQISRTSEFPYREGAELMGTYPKEESWRRSAIFAQALSSYAANEHKQMQAGEGFSEMISSNWRELPPEQVEQGIDEVFKQAKNNKDAASVTLSSDTGEQATFTSIYEFRLFQLLPVLREINKGKADELLKEDQAIQGLLSKYPNGQESLSPKPQNASLKRHQRQGMSTMVRMPDKSGGNGQQQQQLPQVDEGQAWQAQADRIVASAADDPKQALAQAQTLPAKMKMFGGDFPIRANALRGIANSCLKSNPTVARQAIADMVKSLPDVDPGFQVTQLVEAAKLYLKLSDDDNAKKVLDSAIPKANELVKSDENSDEPNRAFKAYWPSAAAWQSLLRTGERISPAYAETMIAAISDDEIRVLSKIALADELAGAPKGRTIVAENRKGKNMIRMNDSDDDD